MSFIIIFFFFNDTATTEIYTLSLHDALPISFVQAFATAKWPTYYLAINSMSGKPRSLFLTGYDSFEAVEKDRSEEHTSELQSHSDLVCRLLLEKKKKKKKNKFH